MRMQNWNANMKYLNAYEEKDNRTYEVTLRCIIPFGARFGADVKVDAEQQRNVIQWKRMFKVL